MSFVSIEFLLFTLALLIIYYLVPKKVQQYVLLAGSVLFYAFSGVRYLIYLFGIAGIAYIGALNFDRQRKAQKQKVKYSGLIVAVIVILMVLFVVKYSGFAVKNINRIAGTKYSIPSIIMPLGISYYSFAAIGYLLDVKHGKYIAERNFFKFLLFISYFPQIIQGPIPRFDALKTEFDSEHKFSLEKSYYAILLIVWGVFKKLVIADNIAVYSSKLFDGYKIMNGVEIVICIALWGIQIYMDFSGGIDVARGVSECFGISLVRNFNRPYFSENLRDFWNRWHISLSHWMRDYVFYPIAFSKPYSRFSKALRSVFGKEFSRNLPMGLASIVIFTLIGLWHGAKWGEIFFGFINGAVICVSSILEPLFKKIRKLLRMDYYMGWKAFRIIRTFAILSFARLFSYSPSLTATKVMIKRIIFSVNAPLSGNLKMSFYNFLPIFAAFMVVFTVSVIEEETKEDMRVLLKNKPIMLSFSLMLLGILYILIFGNYGLGFNPADFVYSRY